MIIATGASAKRMDLPGEETYWQSGISACAVCDGAVPIFRNKPLAVIGGGDSACEEATYLTKYASHVYVLCRREQLRASKVMAKRLKSHPKVTILWNSVATEACGDGVRPLGVTAIWSIRVERRIGLAPVDQGQEHQDRRDQGPARQRPLLRHRSRARDLARARPVRPRAVLCQDAVVELCTGSIAMPTATSRPVRRCLTF